MKQQNRWLSVFLVPTGVGASIGGYAGDATQALHQIASVSPACLTHPNVLNAAIFFNKPTNTLYVEGFGIDRFLQGHIALRAIKNQSIGLLWDAGIDPRMRVLHENTVRAVQTIYGINVAAETTTGEPLSLWCELSQTGTASGGLQNPHVLLASAQALYSQGAQAIAVMAAFPDVLHEQGLAHASNNYLQGNGVDPVGGLEAIISRLITMTVGVPCAHAPVFTLEAAMPEFAVTVDPRVASEAITMTFLPCILQGLSQAPQYIPAAEAIDGQDWQLTDVRCVIVPENTLGGPGTLAAMAHGIPIIMVRENQSICQTKHLAAMGAGPVLTMNSYEDVAIWLAQQS